MIVPIHGNKTKMNRLSLKSIMFWLASKKISYIFWVSKSCFDTYYFKKKVSDKSVVLPNIISIDDLKQKVIKSNENYKSDIIFLGRLVYEKNPMRLIEIINLVSLKFKNLKVSIVGDGEFLNQMQEKVNEFGLQDVVKFWGFKQNPYGLLKNSKLMLLTSIMEGTPMCAIEALACSVPVVATKTDGLVDLLDEKTGFLYDSNEEAASAILSILENDQKLASLKRGCEEFSKAYNDIQAYKDIILKGYLN